MHQRQSQEDGPFGGQAQGVLHEQEGEVHKEILHVLCSGYKMWGLLQLLRQLKLLKTNESIILARSDGGG